MKFKNLLLGILWLVMTFGAPTALPAEEPAPRQLSPEAAKVAEDFIFAFSKNERAKITELLPKQLRNVYGPCPFLKMPTLTKPRADKRDAAIEFQGERADSSMPQHGVIVLRRIKEGENTVWHVRQMYWYDELPPDAQVPEKSSTAADRKEEPRVVQAVTEFIQTWLTEDYEKLDHQVFHWWEIDRKPPKWVKLSRVDLKQSAVSLGGVRVNFAAKLRLIGALPKSVSGMLWLVQEDGNWRVRPLTVAFAF